MAFVKFGGITCITRLLVAWASFFPLACLQAAPPETLNYAGRILVDGQAFDGTGQFKFALVNADGNATYWKNAGSGAGEPTAAVTLQVTAGVYTVRLGDVSIPNMAPLSGSLFQSHDDVHLRVWFDDGSNGLQLLAPDRAIASVAYALSANRAQVAESVAPNVITSEMLSVDLRNLVESNASIAPGSITAGMLAPGLLADLNATAPAGDGNGSAVVAPAGSLIAVQSGQSVPTGYSLYQQGAPKELVWEEKAPVSVARSAYDGVESLDGKIYFVGGHNGSTKNIAERYDPASNQWETLAPMSLARKGVAAAVLNGKLYAIGGEGHTSVEIFDPQTGQWSAGPSLPSEVNHGTAITVGGKILLVGGRNSADQNINQVLELDPATNQWSQKAAMPTVRHGTKLVSFNDKVWAIGGHNDGNQLDKVEIYDLATDSWTSGTSLTTSRAWPSAWVANGRVYVAGGNNGSSYLNSIKYFDSFTNQWTAAGSLPENKFVADSAILGGKVYVVAGNNGSSYSNKVFAADLNASLAAVFDLYFRDGNASAGGAVVAGEVGDGSVTPNKLSPDVVAALKPVILQQPQSTGATGGLSATFVTQATGGNLTYQWRQEGYAIAGANGNFLTITDLNATLHDGNYTVTVTNAFGSTESAVATLEVNGSVTQGLVGWWKFDETSGTVATDSSGNGNHGNLQNGPTWAQGKIGGALQLDGVNDYVEVSSRQWGFTNTGTVSLWFLKSASSAMTIFSLGRPSYNDEILLNSDSASSLIFYHHHSGGNHAHRYSPHNNSVWNHFVGVLEGGFTSEKIHFYLNSQSGGTYDTSGSPAMLSDTNSRKLRIGLRVYGSGHFNGLIDDVRIYDRALSAAEVTALYDLGSGASPTTATGGGATIVADSGPVTTEKLSDGAVTTEKLSETILKYLKPEITAHPQATNVYSDTNASFSVSAEGKYLTYQWKKDGADLVGENNATLTITDANAPLHDGNYTVTVSNDFGSVASQNASFSVVDIGSVGGLVGWWKFDETNSAIAYDSSGNLRNGSLIGFDSNTTQWVQGKIGRALSLDGVNDYVNIDGYKGILGSSPRTTAAWVKTALGDAAIIAWGAVNTGQKWTFRIQTSSGLVGATRLEINGGLIVGNVAVNDNQWHHVAAVLPAGSDNSNQVVLYVDGANAGSSYSTSNTINTVSDPDVLIGKRMYGGSHFFNGLIDDVRIYDRGLSAAEVQALYQLGGN
ncbi:MAG: hypothetical protein CMI31_10830 [Opitutae bacterium]|nr:hypothetical protein [Opitutae bacterium]